MAEQKLPAWAQPGWTPKKVLAPLDGSYESERALWKCLPLLVDLDVELTLLGVIDAIDPVELRDPKEVTEPAALAGLERERQHSERATNAARSYLDGIRATIAGLKDVRSRGAYGDAPEQIVKTADEIDADMVIMATRRESSLLRGIIGSTTSRVLHELGRPLLVVRVENEGAPTTVAWPQNVITPLDVTPTSEMAVDASISLAKVAKADLRFLRVTPRIYYPASGGALEYAGSGIFYGSELRGEAFEYLSAFVDRARSEGIEAFAEARSGSAANEIVELATELPDALVVMTTHAREGFLRMTLGSTADKVVRALALPVLLLPVNRLGE